jgi:hypothetical protein
MSAEDIETVINAGAKPRIKHTQRKYDNGWARGLEPPTSSHFCDRITTSFSSLSPSKSFWSSITMNDLINSSWNHTNIFCLHSY